MYKFTGFTEKANTALNIAVETAEDLGHTYIGSEHLLIGLLRDTGGVACVALAGRGVTAAQVEELMRKTIGIGAQPSFPQRILRRAVNELLSLQFWRRAA